MIGWNLGLSTPKRGLTTFKSSVTVSSSRIVCFTGAKCF